MNYLNEYWSQITVILGAIGFIINYLLKRIDKKKEIQFSGNTKTKIDEVKIFYRNYIELEEALRSLHFATAQTNVEHEKEIRKTLPSLWKEFRISLHFLKIFSTKNEQKLLIQLSNQLEEIHKQIDFFCIDRNMQIFDSKTRKALLVVRDEIFPNKIPNLLDEIENNLRMNFGIFK